MTLADSKILNRPVGHRNIDGTEMIIAARKTAGFVGCNDNDLLFIIVDKNEKGRYRAKTCWYILDDTYSEILEKYTGFRFNELIMLDDWEDYTDIYRQI